MTYDLNHWKNVRRTIATKYKDNDFAYSTDGAIGAIKIYSMFDLKPSEAKKMTILDYGCGSGRVARILTALFKTVVAYDPVEECIEEMKKENELSHKIYNNLIMTSNINEVPQCDIACSINVIEHLNDKDQNIMLINLAEKVSGETVINYSVSRNQIMKQFLTEVQIKEDVGASIQLRKLWIRI